MEFGVFSFGGNAIELPDYYP